MGIKLTSLLGFLLFFGVQVFAQNPPDYKLIAKINKAFRKKFGKSNSLNGFIHENKIADTNRIFHSILSSKDTIYFIYQYYSPYGPTNCMSWNKSDTACYSVDIDCVSILNRKLFNNKALAIISKWDSLVFNNSHFALFDIGGMYIARIVPNKIDYIIDCFLFYQQVDWQD